MISSEYLKLSLGNEVWICTACDRHIKAGKVPPESVINGFTYPIQPLPLRVASLLEERLVSPRTAFINLLERPSGGQLSCRGGIVKVPNRLKHSFKQIPRHARESELICVDFKRRIKDSHAYLSVNIRPFKVHEMARELVNTPLHQLEKITR